MKNLQKDERCYIEIRDKFDESLKQLNANNISYHKDCPNRIVIDSTNFEKAIELMLSVDAKIVLILTIHAGLGYANEFAMMRVHNILDRHNIYCSVYDENVWVRYEDIDKVLELIKKINCRASLC